MIKSKTLDIKIIFKNIKNRLKTFQVPEKTFILRNFKEQFSKVVVKNCFSELFENSYQTRSQSYSNLSFSIWNHILMFFALMHLGFTGLNQQSTIISTNFSARKIYKFGYGLLLDKIGLSLAFSISLFLLFLIQK